MKDVKRSTMKALRTAELNGDAILHFLLPNSTPKINIRCAAGMYHHVDWMCRSQPDFLELLRIAGLSSTANFIRNWGAFPGIIEFTTRGITHYFAIAIFIVNHSVVVASHAFEIVSPRLRRTLLLSNGRFDPATLGAAFERDINGNWNPGHHFCFHTNDSRALRGSTNNQYNDGFQKTLDAERLAKVIQLYPTPEPPKVVNYQIRVATQTLPLNARRNPTTQNSAVIGKLPIGSIHTIVRESTGIGASMWGQLPPNHPIAPNGWISLDLTRPHTLAPIIPIGSWRVQVGALRTQHGAEIIVDQLAALEYTDICIVSGNGFYRPRVGRLPSKEQAIMLENELITHGFETWVLQEVA
jgi:hypothetical protein